MTLLVALAIAWVGVPSFAAPPVAGGRCDRLTGACDTWASETSTRTTESLGRAAGSGGSGSATVCTFREREIACSTSAGTWSPSVSGYCHRSASQPAASASVWGGRTDGAVYDCASPTFDGSVADLGIGFQRWLPSAPDLPPPDPELLARRALASITVSPVLIGTMPRATSQDPESMGIVGFPVWLWADPAGTQPQSASASERGFTVRITASLDSVAWDLGDGGPSVTCKGPGVPFTGSTLSPDSRPPCGRQTGYQKQGEYTVTATAHWAVNWSGIGQSGVIPLELTSQEMVRVGELQVVNVND